MELEITSTVPPPERKHARGREPVYPFAKMQVGDSFFTSAPVVKVGPSARQWGKRNGVRFTCRTEGRGARVWRVE